MTSFPRPAPPLNVHLDPPIPCCAKKKCNMPEFGSIIYASYYCQTCLCYLHGPRCGVPVDDLDDSYEHLICLRCCDETNKQQPPVYKVTWKDDFEVVRTQGQEAVRDKATLAPGVLETTERTYSGNLVIQKTNHDEANAKKVLNQRVRFLEVNNRPGQRSRQQNISDQVVWEPRQKVEFDNEPGPAHSERRQKIDGVRVPVQADLERGETKHKTDFENKAAQVRPEKRQKTDLENILENTHKQAKERHGAARDMVKSIRKTDSDERSYVVLDKVHGTEVNIRGAHEASDTSQETDSVKKPDHPTNLAKYGSRYSTGLKLQVLEEIANGMTMKDASRKYNVAYGTIKRWNQTRSAESTVLDGKARCDSPQWREEQIISECYEARNHVKSADKLHFSGALVSQLAINAKKILQEHNQKPMLTEQEEKAIRACLFSESWAKKLARKLEARYEFSQSPTASTQVGSPVSGLGSIAVKTKDAATTDAKDNQSAPENATVNKYDELKLKQLSSIAEWLEKSVIGYGANAVEMQEYANRLLEFGFHSVELIKEICTPEDVEGFGWMKAIHKRLFLLRANLKSKAAVAVDHDKNSW